MIFGNHVKLLAAVALVGALLLPVIIGGRDVIEGLLSLTFLQVLIFFTPVLTLFLLNTLRIWILIPENYNRLTFFSFFRICASCEFFSKTTPGGAGGFAAALVLVRPYQVPSPVVIGVFSLSVMQDVAAILLILVLSMLVVGEALSVSAVWLYASGIMLAFLVAVCLIIVVFGKGWIDRRTRRYKTLRDNLGKLLDGAKRVTASIASVGWFRFCLSSAVSLVYWLLHLSILYWVIKVASEQVSWAYAALLQFFVMGAGHMSLSPGGAGVVEAGAIAGLLPFISAGKAAFIVILWRLFTQYVYIFFGGVAFLLERAIVSRNPPREVECHGRSNHRD